LSLQGQFLGVEPLQLRARLDKIASSGIPIWMSEVNVNILDVNKRADYLEFIFRECFAHPAVKGFLFWYNYQTQDVYNQFGGQCNACLANLDYSLNPAGQRVLVSVARRSPFPVKLFDWI
jgi:endo-1,4-beta-xylanase